LVPVTGMLYLYVQCINFQTYCLASFFFWEQRGSSIARVCAQNTIRHPELFEREVRMWVFEEQVDGKNLTDIINEKHENVK
jgi:hypothetical protein